jgi:hypothetical protein
MRLLLAAIYCRHPNQKVRIAVTRLTFTRNVRFIDGGGRGGVRHLPPQKSKLEVRRRYTKHLYQELKLFFDLFFYSEYSEAICKSIILNDLNIK